MQNTLYLSQLHELPNFCHPGQKPLINLQGLLTITFFHLEEFFWAQKHNLISCTRVMIVCLYLQHLLWTHLTGWWSHRCRRQTVSPDLWREAGRQRWWSRCSAPWGEPERRWDSKKYSFWLLKWKPLEENVVSQSTDAHRTPGECRSESAEQACLSAASQWSWFSSLPQHWEDTTQRAFLWKQHHVLTEYICFGHAWLDSWIKRVLGEQHKMEGVGLPFLDSGEVKSHLAVGEGFLIQVPCISPDECRHVIA